MTYINKKQITSIKKCKQQGLLEKANRGKSVNNAANAIDEIIRINFNTSVESD